MTKGCEDHLMFESEGQIHFASLKYEQLPLFCNHCAIVGHSLGTCHSFTDKRPPENKATHWQDRANTETWVKKDKPIEEGSKGLRWQDNVEMNKEVTLHNGFDALEGLDGEENVAENIGGIENDSAEDQMDRGKVNTLEGIGEQPQDNSVVPLAAQQSPGCSENRSEIGASVSRRQEARGKARVTKEYNLRNKATSSSVGARLSSPPHDNTYSFNPNADTEALNSMRMVAKKSWANLCEEDTHPPKHGDKRAR